MASGLLAISCLLGAAGCPSADGKNQPLAAAQSLGNLPGGQAKSVGIDLQAADLLRAAGFTPDLSLLANDAQWFDEMEAVPLGAHPANAPRGGSGSQSAEGSSPEMWRDMGFVAEGDGRCVRQADLIGGLPTLVPTDVPGLDHIDCIATISIDRHNGAEPYLYATLRSLFAAFPAGVHVNVLVSNTDVDYVSPAALAAHVGASYVGQVHVHAASAETATYLQSELPAYRRGGWNYARALRSYAGSKGLVLIEDDVQWSLGGPSRLDAFLGQETLPTISLFNDHCAHLSGEANHQKAAFRINKVFGETHYFVNLQGMYYHHALANSLGRYLQLRMHREIYDHVIGWYFKDHKITIGYAFPSIVQHIGKNSAAKDGTYSWAFHDSSCFRESF